MRINIYFAGWVRGPEGNQATYDSVMANVSRNIEQQDRIMEYLSGDTLNQYRFYSPHKHEGIYQIVGGWAEQRPDEREMLATMILDQCKDILGLCDIMLVLDDPEHSSGIRAEMEYAREKGILLIPWWAIADCKPVLDNLDDELLRFWQQLNGEPIVEWPEEETDIEDNL